MKRERPKGSKNKKKINEMEEELDLKATVPAEKKGRGRPKGSKNKKETFKSIMIDTKLDMNEQLFNGIVDYNNKKFPLEQL